MTVNEFINYFKLGHGKAVTLLRDETDKKQFQKAFIGLIKDRENMYGKYDYADRIMHILRDKEFVTELKSELIQTVRSGENINAYIFLYNLGYSEIALESLKFVYAENYRALTDMLKSGISDGEEYIVTYRKYSAAFEGLADYRWHNMLLPELIKDNAELYLISENVIGYPPVCSMRLASKENGSEEWFIELIDETLKGHKAYELFRSIVFPVIPEPKNREYKTADDFYNADFDDFHAIKSAFVKASPEVVRRLAEIMESETDLNRKQKLMCLFMKDENYYGTAPIYGSVPDYPLSPRFLIDVFNEYLEAPTDGIFYSAEAHELLPYDALEILSGMKNQEAREFCLSVFMNEKLYFGLRILAFYTLIENYASGDEKLLRDVYSTDFKDEVIVILYNLSKKGIKDAPYDLLFDAYETTYVLDKALTVQALINMDLITPEMLNECLNDAYYEVVESAKKEITKRLIEKVNCRTDGESGWNSINNQDEADFLLTHTCRFHDSKFSKFEYAPVVENSFRTPVTPILMKFNVFYYDEIYEGIEIGLEMLCDYTERFNFTYQDDMISAVTVKFADNGVLFGIEPGPALELNKYGFSDEQTWLKCKSIKWRLSEE